MDDPQHGTHNSGSNDNVINTTSTATSINITTPSHFKSHRDEELIRLALHKSPFFSCLDEEQLDRFVAAASLRTFQPRQVVISEGRIDETEADDDDDHDNTMQQRLWATTDGGQQQVETVQTIIDAVQEDEVGDNLLLDLEQDDLGDHELDQDEESFASKSDRNEEASTAVVLSGQHTTGGTAAVVSIDQEDRQDRPHPLKSGIPRLLYIVRAGHAGVWLRQPTSSPTAQSFRPATLGEGNLFGEGGFLFGRQHSASVVVGDDGPLECWVVDFATFRDAILRSDRTSKLFHAHARSVDETTGEPYMTVEDFVQAVTANNGDVMGGGSIVGGLALPQESSLLNLHIANTFSVLNAPPVLQQKATTTATTTQSTTTQRLYLNDFCFFHFIVARPDPEVDLAFLLMDDRQTGKITIDDLKRFLTPVFPNLDFRQAFFQRYFGPNGDKSIRQGHFSQFLVDLQREIGKQAFLSALAEQHDSDYLCPADFVKILKSSAWRIPAGVIARLETLYNSDDSDDDANSNNSVNRERGPFFTYGDFLAFQEVLGNLPFVCNMVNRAQDVKGTKYVSPDDFKVANQVFGLGDRFSRRQVDIVFQLFDLDKDGFISHNDTVQVCGLDFARRLVLRDGKLAITATQDLHSDRLVAGDHGLHVEKHDDVRWTQRLAARILDFSLAAIFGGFTVGVLYPIDIVKTRIMNQRHGAKSTVLYQGPLDCLRQIIRNEGTTGLYRGIVPNLMCVAPERAIKLQVHHLVKEAVCSVSDSDPTQTNLWIEAFSGGCAGASQILITNPMEIAKIRLQMQGETRRVLLSKGITPLSSPGFSGVMRGLGFPGVYRGASACLLRDIPFSAIYFTSYAALKNQVLPAYGFEQCYGLDTLLAGTAAAIPAALLTTPADVVKTRLQTIARPGETTYHGIDDCFRKILDEEGPIAFTRGGLTRVLRIAPQFGISMLAFETVTKLLDLSSYDTARPPTDIPVVSTKR